MIEVQDKGVYEASLETIAEAIHQPICQTVTVALYGKDKTAQKAREVCYVTQARVIAALGDTQLNFIAQLESFPFYLIHCDCVTT
jgi:hypothetical protein